MLMKSFSLLLGIELGSFPFVLPPCKKSMFLFMQPKSKNQNHARCYSALTCSYPIVEAKTITVGKLLSEPTKAALHSIFNFAGLFYEHCKCFLLTKPLSGCLTEMTSFYRSGSMPHLFKQSKANQQKWKPFDFNGDFIAFSFQESF